MDADDPRALSGTPVPVQAQPAAPEPAVVPGQVAAQPQPGQVVPGQDELANISLRLDNTDIYQVIKIIADALQLNYIIDPAVRGTVNISTSGNLRRSDLMPLLETILKINNATMVQNGNFYQIVPAASAIRQPLAVQDSRPTTAVDDQIVLQIVRMRFVLASQMAALLTPYLSEGANIVSHDAGNILLVSERRSNLRKLLEIVDIFDTNIFEGERVRMFPVTQVLASDLVLDLEKIMAGYGLSTTGSAVRFIALDRLNSILAISSNPTVFAEVERWIERLQQPSASAGVRNYVYKVRNSRASAIQQVLSQLYSNASSNGGGQVPQSPASPVAPGTQAAPGAQTTPGTAPGAGAPAAQPGIPVTLESNIRIIADEPNNALVIQATPQEYAEILATITELDVLKRQVLIDAQIYEVVLDHGMQLGISALLQSRGPTQQQTTASFASTGTGPPSLSAQTFAYIGRARELLLFLNASENRSRVRTLSAPSLMVSDNTQAEIQVGSEVPIPTSSSITPVQSDGTNLFAQTIQFRTTGVILRVRPQINDSGNVTLDIAQEVSQAGQNTTSAIVAPVIGKSSVNSTVVVRDGETIALSGFVRESNLNGSNRVPLLGSIPGLGILFGNTTRSENRTELVVLITPHVARTFEETDMATEELKARLKEIQKFMK